MYLFTPSKQRKRLIQWQAPRPTQIYYQPQIQYRQMPPLDLAPLAQILTIMLTAKQLFSD
jgi:hypothetical protein